MAIPQIQKLVRELITETDHLSRVFHQAAEPTRAGRMAALRSSLLRLDRGFGGEAMALHRGPAPRTPFALGGELDVIYQRARDVASAGLASRELDALVEHASSLRRSWHAPGAAAPAGRRQAAVIEWLRSRSNVLLVGGLGALVVPFLAPSLRRSRVGWGIAAAVASVSIGWSAMLRGGRG